MFDEFFHEKRLMTNVCEVCGYDYQTIYDEMIKTCSSECLNEYIKIILKENKNEKNNKENKRSSVTCN